MADAMTSMKNKAGEMGNAFSQAASTAAEECQTISNHVVDKAKSAVNEAAKAGDYLEGRAEDARVAVGEGLKSAGGSVRSRGPQAGHLGQATHVVADSLSQSGDYLQHKRLPEIGHDLTDLVRRNPVPSLLIGIGLGFLLARAFGRN